MNTNEQNYESGLSGVAVVIIIAIVVILAIVLIPGEGNEDTDRNATTTEESMDAEATSTDEVNDADATSSEDASVDVEAGASVGEEQ